MGLLDGKVAIITGAGGGIGRCHALLFAREGAKVVVNDLGGSLQGAGDSPSMADGVVEEIKAAGGEAVASYGSVASYDDANAMIQAAVDTFGRADILINNAGILRDKTLLKLEERDWDSVIAVHLKGTFLCGQAFARHAKQRADAGDKGGRIINTSSYAGLKGNYGQTNYSAAKAGIYGLTATWAQELQRAGVTVNCLAPMAKTRMTQGIEVVTDDMQPEHISPMALYLASDMAKDVTGRVFGIHGQQLLEYKMLMTDGVTKEGAAYWTPEEIHGALDRIGADQPPAAAPAGGAPLSNAQLIATAFGLMPKVFRPDRAKGWAAVLQFDITGGTPWTVTIKDGACTTQEGKHGEATCVVTVDEATYADVVTGKQKAEKAFMAGKIKASNLGDMMKMGSAFDMKKAAELAKAKAAQATGPAATTPAAPAAAAPPSNAQLIATAFGLLPKVFRPDRAQGWAAVLQFDITGGTPWTITIQDGTCTTQEGKHGEATCVVTVDEATYADVVTGKQKAEKAFMAGKIKASNLGDMMQMGSAFDMKKAAELAKAGAAPAAAPAAAAAAAPPSNAQLIATAFGLLPKVFRPDRAQGWAAVLQFDITGGTPWTITIQDGACTTQEGKHGEATCVVTVDEATYADVVTGKQKAEKAFMAGKIKASNLGDMMKMGSAFDMKKAAELAKAGAAPAAAPAAAAAAEPAGPEALVTRSFELLADAYQPAAAPGWNAVLRFQIDGTEPWTATIQDGTCQVAKGEQGEPTCLIRTRLVDYAKIISGELRAEQAFMKGRISASNLKDMMQFGRAFDLKTMKAELETVGSAEAPAQGTETRLNQALIGKVYTGEPCWARPEHVALFAGATEDPNPAYEGDGAIAPPMFSVRLFKDVLFRAMTDEELGADMLNLVHGEQDMEFFRPLHPWDLCATRSVVTAIEAKSTGELLSLEERLYTAGELAVRVRASMFIRDPSKKKPAGEKKAPAPEPKRPELAFSESVTVADDQSRRYAEASLDNNPIHTDAEVAKLAGFKGVILHGLCTMSFASKAVMTHACGGDPRRLARLGARFNRPVSMGDVLTTEAWALDAKAGVQVYGFRVVNQDGAVVIKDGVAEVRD